MKFRSLIPAALAAVLVTSLAPISQAALVTPYTEEFVSDNQDWINGKSMAAATWVSTGGPDGSSFISASMDTSTNMAGSSRVIFRGNTTEIPELHASDDKFYGDWIAGGVNHLSFWAYHNAPVALPFIARIATAGNSPAIAFNDGTLVQPNTWTKIDYTLDSSYLGLTITAEAAPGQELATYNQVLHAVERIQIGFNTPAEMAIPPIATPPNPANPVASTSFTYRLDKVSVYTGSIPEPSTLCLLLSSAGLVLIRRRRAA